MEMNKKKKDNISKLFMIVCVGVLLLIVVLPTQRTNTSYKTYNDKEQEKTEKDESSYYEDRLKRILENTYGTGTMDVMIHMDKRASESMFYNDDREQFIVDGVLVVAQVRDLQAVSDITFAVCALFDLPAHKVAVMIKNSGGNFVNER